MKNITLIGTVHQDRGRASSSELNVILMRIKPEIIFVEEPPSRWRGLDELSNTKPMEFGAISKYIETQSTELVPVDLFTEQEPYIRNVREVLCYVERVSDIYCQLTDANEVKIQTEGFAYLNSDLYESIQLAIHNEVQRILGLRRSKPLDQAYEAWISQDDKRETEMLSNIEKYGHGHSFERAAFLVGAGHRASIVKKIVNRELNRSSILDWNTNILHD